MASTSKVSKPNIRKKFAVPPVKVACLDCRASRTRCDGKQQCSNCIIRGKTCVYAQSRRGGPRVRKRAPSPETDDAGKRNRGRKVKTGNARSIQPPAPAIPELSICKSLLRFVVDFFSLPTSLLEPGAYLKQTAMSFDESELMFDSVFGDNHDTHDSGYGTSDVERSVEPEETIGPVRVYKSDEDILNAYYVHIHQYFPILPPPNTDKVFDSPEVGFRDANDAIFGSHLAPDFEPSTPLSFAISATLALIPHPSDPNSSSPESTLLRREQSQAFAQSAIESIEIETELIDSSIRPGDALSNGPAVVTRQRFHQKAPVENESILALLMLSTYEYAQRGNIAKMKSRAGVAVAKAMDLGLHAKGHEKGEDAEANRRACLRPLTILLYDPRFTTSGPTFASDGEAWSVFLQAQQVIVMATQFVIDLDTILKMKSDPSELWERMLELESLIEPLATRADSWNLSSLQSTTIDAAELGVTHSLRGIARIKLNSARIKVHRYCAFSDVPVFTKKHCDLAAIPQEPSKDETFTPICPCSSTYHSTIQGILEPSSKIQSRSTFSQSTSNGDYTTSGNSAVANCGILPFSSHFSAKVCLRAAFNIARSFQSLPFPPSPATGSSPPSHLEQLDNSHKSPELASQPPRMVPVFACCAMQSSYAMVMLAYKSHAMALVNSASGPAAHKGDCRTSTSMSGEKPVKKLIERLEEGLDMILEALRNYCVAYEALHGMRDQIEVAARGVGSMGF
ncbi:Xylanolytic transcriptional activator xlnR [Hyphodiscus hymeniophilus]|uniref:Xylanolytic transcriptional activator xlnR n=1 Tax=Hyphodiscus hymeniophilus TaxID=353542 RepID=A0A9P6VEW6_9HELO|nr:Xylanolytic transcriptional activator xlnR [Hyphodiscus hymeniophilus]